MAISGLHIAMVAALAAWAGSAVQRWRQRRGALLARRDVAAIAGALAALVYGALAGASIPTQRTLIMIACGAAALCARRRVAIADGLGFCAAAVVMLDPLAPLAPGFWLSFGAVAAILFGATGYVTQPSWWRSYLHVQGIVTLGLLPVLIGSFGSVSLVSALVNLRRHSSLYARHRAARAGLLRDGAGMARSGIAAVAHDGAPDRDDLALDRGARVLAAGDLGRGRARAGRVGRADARHAGAARATAGGGTRGRARAGRRRLLLAPVARGSRRCARDDPRRRAGARRGRRNAPPRARLRCGAVIPQRQQHRPTRHRAVPAAPRHTRHRRVVVTHDDDDHKGGAASLMALFPTSQLVTGPSIRAATLPAPPGTERAACRRGDRWEWDGVQFEWLHPGSEPYERDNDSSCVLLVRAGEHEVLLTGDIEAAAEGELSRAGAMPARSTSCSRRIMAAAPRPPRRS